MLVVVKADFWSINLLVRKQTPLDKGGPHQVRCDGSNFSPSFFFYFLSFYAFQLFFIFSFQEVFYFISFLLLFLLSKATVWRIKLFGKFLFLLLFVAFQKRYKNPIFQQVFIFFLFWTVSSKGAMDPTFGKCFDWFLCSQKSWPRMCILRDSSFKWFLIICFFGCLRSSTHPDMVWFKLWLIQMWILFFVQFLCRQELHFF